MDLVVYATGFDVERSMCGFAVKGRDPHRTLYDGFKSKLAAAAFLGICVDGYPNFFLLVGPNSVLFHNSVVFMIECQVNYVMDVLQQMMEHGIETVDVKTDVVDDFRKEVAKVTQGKTISSPSCNSWYKNSQGSNVALWPTYTIDFWLRTRRANLLKHFKLTFESE